MKRFRHFRTLLLILSAPHASQPKRLRLRRRRSTWRKASFPRRALISARPLVSVTNSVPRSGSAYVTVGAVGPYGPAGPGGPQRPAGATGPTGATGPRRAAWTGDIYSTANNSVAVTTAMANMATLSLSAGSYWISAKAWLESGGSDIINGQIGDDSSSYNTTGPATLLVALSLQRAQTLSAASSVSLQCGYPTIGIGTAVTAYNIQLAAIPVTNITAQ
jgi:hypothetical protein